MVLRDGKKDMVNTAVELGMKPSVTCLAKLKAAVRINKLRLQPAKAAAVSDRILVAVAEQKQD